jgi:clan AA aspartic protease (TIGR02281 family)
VPDVDFVTDEWGSPHCSEVTPRHFTNADVATTAPVCANHRSVPASGSCIDCLKEICDVCTAVSLEHLCTLCARARRDRRVKRNTLFALAVVAAVVATVVFATRAGDADAHAGESLVEMASASAPEVVPANLGALDAELRREPCDRQRAYKLVDGLYRAREPRLALRRADAFFQKCGTFTELLPLTYAAHRDLSEWDLALADVSKLMEAQPHDKDYPWWRAQLYEQKGEIELAARDYDQAIVIEPKITNIPFNLANIYERLGRPCDGIFPLTQFAYFHPEASEAANKRLSALYASPGCSGLVGTGRATIPYTPGAAAVPVRVRINGSVEATFILDTGASVVVLPEALARKLSIDASAWRETAVATAGGLRMVRRGAVDQVEVQALRARQVPCAISSELPGDVGLLGLSFLSRFDLRFDAAHRKITLAARDTQ